MESWWGLAQGAPFAACFLSSLNLKVRDNPQEEAMAELLELRGLACKEVQGGRGNGTRAGQPVLTHSPVQVRVQGGGGVGAAVT